MFFYLCQIIITLAGYAYPAYSSYKAVKTNDAAQLEVWLMYWVVIAFVSVAEMTVEWTISWIPFYWELKTLIVLWLTLPQIQGSTFVYVTFVHPFLTTHEPEIEAAIADAKDKARAAGLEYIRRAFRALKEVILPAALAESVGSTNNPPPPPPSDQPPANAVDAYPSIPWSPATLTNILRTYGPSAIAAGSALFHPMGTRTAQAAATAARAGTSGNGSASARSSSNAYHEREKEATLRQRREEIERELQVLDNLSSAPSPPASIPSRSTPSVLSMGAMGMGRPPNSANSSLNRRSVSAVETPRDPVARRIEQSFGYGGSGSGAGAFSYEDIRREEVEGWDKRRSFPSSDIRDDGHGSPASAASSQSRSWWYGRWAPGTMGPVDQPQGREKTE